MLHFQRPCVSAQTEISIHVSVVLVHYSFCDITEGEGSEQFFCKKKKPKSRLHRDLLYLLTSS